MTKQEFYDRIIEAVKDGTLPSYDPAGGYWSGGSCMYRYTDDAGKEHRCVAGLLLPPDVTAEERQDVYNQSRVFTPLLPAGMTLDDLQAAQRCHDGLLQNGEWSVQGFLDRINGLKAFADVNKVESVEVAA